jgi:hypothetical protein
MAINISDRNGRALEYAITTDLVKASSYASLTLRAISDNARDLPKFQLLSSALQKDYLTASTKISTWVNAQFGIDSKVIDRLPDLASSVADIEIKSKTKTLLLSVKHNHFALKHPRPYSLAQAFGFIKNTTVDKIHRADMKAVADKFRLAANGVQKYTEAEIAKQQMLVEICQVCESSINKWLSTNQLLSVNLFKFIVSGGFYKVIVETRGSIPVVKIQDYFAISLPSSANATSANNRLIVKFNNGWDINMRIHTADEKISKPSSQLSLKFDAQRDAGGVNEITL